MAPLCSPPVCSGAHEDIAGKHVVVAQRLRKSRKRLEDNIPVAPQPDQIFRQRLRDHLADQWMSDQRRQLVDHRFRAVRRASEPPTAQPSFPRQRPPIQVGRLKQAEATSNAAKAGERPRPVVVSAQVLDRHPHTAPRILADSQAAWRHQRSIERLRPRSLVGESLRASIRAKLTRQPR